MTVEKHPRSIAADLQIELFVLFARFFVALTGRAAEDVDAGDVPGLFERQGKEGSRAFARKVHAARKDLRDFYEAHTPTLQKSAVELGGMKLIAGRGSVGFRPSSIRIAGLYADTQLLPDPVEMQLQILDLLGDEPDATLADTLHRVLGLRPLIDARLAVPPLFLVPDPYDSKSRISWARFVVDTVNSHCALGYESLEDFHDELLHDHMRFLKTACAGSYFELWNGGRKAYADPDAALSRMKAICPPGASVSGCISFAMSRNLRAPHRILRYSEDFDAQPLLDDVNDWTALQRVAVGTSKLAVREGVLSKESLGTLRAVQDPSLAWLARIPVEGLVELLRNGEHLWLRKELREYTRRLSETSADDLNRNIKEINHAMASLVQRQEKAIQDIKSKYAPKKWAIYAAGLGGMATGAAAYLTPALMPYLGAAGTPAVIATVAGVSAFGAYAKELISEGVERKKSFKTMMGFLSLAHRSGRATPLR